MFYTLIVILLWLTHGVPKIDFTFNSWVIAFLIAIIVDLVVYKPWVR